MCIALSDLFPQSVVEEGVVLTKCGSCNTIRPTPTVAHVVTRYETTGLR